MIAWKLKTWRTVGLAATAFGLAACAGEGGDGTGETGEAGASGEAGITGESGERAPPAPIAAASAGEAGEAGTSSAYAGLSGDQLTALRIQHLRGFVMAAAIVAADDKPAEAAVLVQQGLLEVYDTAPSEFGDLNVDIIRAAADPSLNRAQVMQRVRSSNAEFDRVLSNLDVDYAALTARMVDIATGIYQSVVQEDFVDPIEYQHSMGAAQAARASLNQNALQRRNLRAYISARRELDRFVNLWPQASAPEHPAPYSEVLAQGSRVRLALSPYL